MFGAFFGFFGEYISVDAHKNQMLHDISVNCDLSFRLIFEQNSESRRNMEEMHTQVKQMTAKDMSEQKFPQKEWICNRFLTVVISRNVCDKMVRDFPQFLHDKMKYCKSVYFV